MGEALAPPPELPHSNCSPWTLTAETIQRTRCHPADDHPLRRFDIPNLERQQEPGAEGGGAVPGLGSQILLSPELSGTRRFKGQAQNYSTLLLEEASARLLVGARGALFSLNAHDIGDGTHKEVSPWSLDHPEGIQLHSAS